MKGRDFDAAALAIVRRAYARQMVTMGGAEDDGALEKAFAAVSRERFLGPPPWRLGRFPSDLALVTDPVLAYQEALFALSPERGVNNGSPSLHARWLHHLRPREGERIAHLGAGTGYYTAILARLVGEGGHVTAVEVDPDLAAMAQANLADISNARVVQGDAAEWPNEMLDGIYVNFMVGRPADAWIDRLAIGGRLVLPIGFRAPPGQKLAGGGISHQRGGGAGFLIEHGENGFTARWIGPAFFVWAEGALAGSERDRDALRAAFTRGGPDLVQGGADAVRSLIWGKPAAPERCWFVGTGWALSYDEAGAEGPELRPKACGAGPIC